MCLRERQENGYTLWINIIVPQIVKKIDKIDNQYVI